MVCWYRRVYPLIGPDSFVSVNSCCCLFALTLVGYIWAWTVRGILRILLLVRRSFYRLLLFVSYSLASTPCLLPSFNYLFLVSFCLTGIDRRGGICRCFYVVVLGFRLMCDLFHSFSDGFIFFVYFGWMLSSSLTYFVSVNFLAFLFPGVSAFSCCSGLDVL